jgi:hypothetical protein
MSFYKFKVNMLFLCMGFLIDFTDIPEQLWLKVFPLNQITFVNVILKSPWFLFNVPFAHLHTRLLPVMSELMQIFVLCAFGAVFCVMTIQSYKNNADKVQILLILTILECIPAFTFTVLNGYLASNISKYNGDAALDSVRVVMIGQYMGRIVSGLIYKEDGFSDVFTAFGILMLVFGQLALLFHKVCKDTYVNLTDEEKGEEQVQKVKTNYRPMIITLLLIAMQPSVSTAVFYLMTGPFKVLPSSITSIKTALSFVRILSSFTGSLGHLSSNNLSFVLITPVMIAHVGYLLFVSQNYTFFVENEIIYFTIGCVSTFGFTIFTLSWNETMNNVAAEEKGQESIIMAKWTTIFFFVSSIPTAFEFACLTVLGIDHGNFNLIPNFALICMMFTIVTWSMHRCLSICRII